MQFLRRNRIVSNITLLMKFSKIFVAKSNNYSYLCNEDFFMIKNTIFLQFCFAYLLVGFFILLKNFLKNS